MIYPTEFIARVYQLVANGFEMMLLVSIFFLFPLLVTLFLFDREFHNALKREEQLKN